MDNNSFVEKHSFMEKFNENQEKDSIYNKNYLVGGYPINKIPNLSKNAQNDLKNYGIPAGLVVFPKNSHLISGGGFNIKTMKSVKDSLPDTIQDYLHDNLIDKVIKNKNSKTNKNKTSKITK